MMLSPFPAAPARRTRFESLGRTPSVVEQSLLRLSQDSTRESSRVLRKGRDKVKTVKVHHLVPGSNEVLDKLFVRVRASVNLRQRAELGVRTEDEIGSPRRPPDLPRLAISSFKRGLRILGRPPNRNHIVQG